MLVDTGIGPGIAPGEGLLLDNLRGEGIAPEDIDVVINTHGHGDHIGANADAEGNPTFTNARYVMSQEDWEFWTDEAQVEEKVPIPEFRELLLSFVRAHMTPLASQFELIGYDEEIVPGITSIAAQGHTPGHMALLVQSDGEQLWIGGDFASHEVTVPNPHFVGVPDVEPGADGRDTQALARPHGGRRRTGDLLSLRPIPQSRACGCRRGCLDVGTSWDRHRNARTLAAFASHYLYR